MSSERSRTYYDILGIMPNASIQQIEDAYHFYASKLANSNDQRYTKELQEAFITLSDPTKRALYDRLLFGGTGTYQTVGHMPAAVETFTAHGPDSDFVMRQKPQNVHQVMQASYARSRRSARRQPAPQFQSSRTPLDYILVFIAIGLPILTIFGIIFILILQTP